MKNISADIGPDFNVLEENQLVALARALAVLRRPDIDEADAYALAPTTVELLHVVAPECLVTEKASDFGAQIGSRYTVTRPECGWPYMTTIGNAASRVSRVGGTQLIAYASGVALVGANSNMVFRHDLGEKHKPSQLVGAYEAAIRRMRRSLFTSEDAKGRAFTWPAEGLAQTLRIATDVATVLGWRDAEMPVGAARLDSLGRLRRRAEILRFSPTSVYAGRPAAKEHLTCVFASVVASTGLETSPPTGWSASSGAWAIATSTVVESYTVQGQESSRDRIDALARLVAEIDPMLVPQLRACAADEPVPLSALHRFAESRKRADGSEGISDDD